MENLPNLFVGKSFNTYTELSVFINEYENHHRQKFWKRSSRKITSTANIKRFINPELVYYEISYSCVHGGEKFKSRSRGYRKSVLGSPCTAYIRLRASPNGETLEIKAFSEQHNHSCTQNRWSVSQVEVLIEQFKKYPVLYDSRHEKYNNTELKNSCVADIVTALRSVRLGVTESDVLSQWNSLVVKYSHTQRKKTQNLRLDGEPQSWYLEKLDFLKEHIVKVEDCDESDLFEPEINTEWENGVPDPLASSSIQIKEEIYDFSKKHDKKSSKDENDIFGEFVAAQLKRMTDDEVRQDAIFEIHQVLHKALKKK